jgi:hypothetical protein
MVKKANEGLPGVVDQENEGIKINLQLFAAGEDDEDEGFYLPDEDVAEDQSQDDEEKGENDQDDADPEPQQQSREENAVYAKMRKRAEAEARAQFETENAQLKSRLAKLETTDARIAIESQITDEMVWKKADEEGISEAAAKKLLYYEIKEQRDEQTRRNEAKIAEVRGKPYYKDIEAELSDWLQKDPSLDPVGAYNYLVGQNIDRLSSKVAETSQKQAIAGIHRDSRRSLVTKGNAGNSADIDYTKVLSKDDIDMANAFGHNPKTIAQYVKSKMKKG